jgi:hypothetical protein
MIWKLQQVLKVSVLKTKSSIALIIGIVVVLLLIPIWYTMLVPSVMASEIEKIDATTSYEGTFTGQVCMSYYGVRKLPIRVEAHLYTEGVNGDNVVLRTDVEMMNITNPDKPDELEELSYNSTFVVNKFTRKNVWGALEADKNRTGYFDPLYPLHLKEGENITNVWLDMSNTTGTLEFKESIVEQGVTFYKYFVNKTTMNTLNLPGFLPGTNFTVMYTKTIWIEPLSGLLAYTENETFRLWWTPTPPSPPKSPLLELIYPLTYRNTAEAKAEGIELAKTTYDGIQLLELYIPTILGVVVIVLMIGFVFNVRRLRRKKAS